MAHGDVELFSLCGGRNKAKIPAELAAALEKLISLELPVVVEGKRDAEALIAIGVPRHRIFLAAQKPLAALLERLRKNGISEIIDMFDADAAGRKKSSALYAAAGKIKINRSLKKIILTQINSKKVEDLLNFLEKNS